MTYNSAKKAINAKYSLSPNLNEWPITVGSAKTISKRLDAALIAVRHRQIVVPNVGRTTTHGDLPWPNAGTQSSTCSSDARRTKDPKLLREGCIEVEKRGTTQSYARKPVLIKVSMTTVHLLDI